MLNILQGKKEMSNSNFEDYKILCLIPSIGTGGAERQMVTLISLLNSKNINPYLLTYFSTGLNYSDNLNVNYIQIEEKGVIKKYLKIIKSIIRVKPDVILSYTEIPNLVSVIASFFLKSTRIVVSERNTNLEYDFFTKILFNSYRFADFVVPNSISQTNFIKENAPFLTSKLRTITNFTDFNKFSIQHKEREVVFKIGIFARYHPQKNIKNFLKSVYEVNQVNSNVEFHWFGEKFLDENGNPTSFSEYYLECENLRSELNLDNVYFKSFSKDIENSFANFDSICLPSLYEGFSNSLSEAICCGKPILASNVCDNVLFVNHGENGFLFDPNSVDDIKNSIIKMVNLENDEIEKFQNNSRLIAENLFSREKFLNDYLEVLL